MRFSSPGHSHKVVEANASPKTTYGLVAQFCPFSIDEILRARSEPFGFLPGFHALEIRMKEKPYISSQFFKFQHFSRKLTLLSIDMTS